MENALDIGKAGEYFVCFDLTAQGYTAYLSEQGLNYDVVLDYKDKLYKIQVKTTSQPRKIPQRKDHIPGYLFNARRCGRNGNRSYQDKDFDIIAFVSLRDKIAAYFLYESHRSTVIFRAPEFRGQYHNEKMTAKRREIEEMLRQGMSFEQIGEHYKQHQSTVRGLLNRNAKSQGEYIDEFPFSKIAEQLK